MLLNAVFFAAKCEEKSINIRRNGIIQNLLEPLKTGLERAKWGLKTCFLAVKSRFLGVKKMASGHPTRKLKWCKMQVMFLKKD